MDTMLIERNPVHDLSGLQMARNVKEVARLQLLNAFSEKADPLKHQRLSILLTY